MKTKRRDGPKVSMTWWLPQYSRRCADEVTDCLGVYRCNQMFQHSILGGLGQDHIEAPLRFPWEGSGDHTRTLCAHPMASYNRRGTSWEWWQLLRARKSAGSQNHFSDLGLRLREAPLYGKINCQDELRIGGISPLCGMWDFSNIVKNIEVNVFKKHCGQCFFPKHRWNIAS